MQQILLLPLVVVLISGIIHGSNLSIGKQLSTDTLTPEKRHRSIGTQASPDDEPHLKQYQSIGTQTSPTKATLPRIPGTNPAAIKPTTPINLHSRDREGNTPLHHAARDGDNDFIKYAVQFGATIDAVNFGSKTPLYFAIEKDKFDTANLLMALGADINKRIGFGYTLLLCAIDRRDMITAGKILQLGPDLAAQTWVCHNSALHLAIAYDLDITALIKAKVPLDLPDHKGQTPIYTAISRNKPDIVLQLVHTGASLTHQDQDQLTPEGFANKHSFFQLAKTLRDIQTTRASDQKM